MSTRYGLFHTRHNCPLVVREVRSGAAFELRARKGREWGAVSPLVAEYIRTHGDAATGVGSSRQFPFHAYDPNELKVIEIVTTISDAVVGPIPQISWLDVARFLADSNPIYHQFITAYENSTPEQQSGYRYTTAEFMKYLQTLIPNEETSHVVV